MLNRGLKKAWPLKGNSSLGPSPFFKKVAKLLGKNVAAERSVFKTLSTL